MCQIEATGFVNAKTLFDARPTGIFSQTRSARDWIGADRHHFGLAVLIRGSGDRAIGLQFGFSSEKDVLKVAIAVDGQGDVGIAGDANGIFPAYIQA